MSRSFNEFELFADELARLRGRMRELFSDTRAVSGLSEMELTVLTATANASTPPTVARIGRSLGHPRQVVQRAANRLVELGLIRLEPNPDHKRAPLLLATERGEATKAADGARARAASDAMLARVGAEEFANATEALRTIRREIETYLRERMA